MRRYGALRLLVPALTVALAVTSCQWPRDPEGTLDRMRGGTLTVGLVESPPWASYGAGDPQGAEVELVERLARQLDAEVSWVEGSESEIVEALERGGVALAIGGFTEDDPWSQQVTFTRPYLRTRVVVAVPRGASNPESIEGRDVTVEQDPEVLAAVRAEDGIPRPVEKLSRETVQSDGVFAVHDWEVSELGLRRTDQDLHESKHVFAVRHGENAWLTRVEGFLLDQDLVALRELVRENDQ